MKRRHYLLFIPLLLIGASNLPGAQESPSVEARVKTMLIDPNSQSPVVVLETVADKKPLPIWIDVPEARAIALELEHVSLPRPLTHDLIRNILQSVGATLKRVTITELRNSTYFANLTLATKEKVIQVDSRPSDAIAIALRMKAPIFVSTQVLAKSKPLPGPTGRVEQNQKKLGFQAQDLTAELAKLLDSQQQKGVLVTDVAAGGVATKAGLQRGDIITKANDQAISSTIELESAIQTAKSPQLKLEVIKKASRPRS
ncbi:MAG: bifunctional nuclease domain-containing protein [Candidatus Binatia bacterium]